MKKQPVRQCVACREKKEKKQLVRVVRSPEGVISIDAVSYTHLDVYKRQHLVKGNAELAHLEAFTDADDGAQSALQGGQNLFVDQGVGLAKILAALRVADNNTVSYTHLIGLCLFPAVIWNAYSIMYTLPDLSLIHI